VVVRGVGGSPTRTSGRRVSAEENEAWDRAIASLLLILARIEARSDR
jgi:hypothetical protein